jgi:hypothetical protein
VSLQLKQKEKASVLNLMGSWATAHKSKNGPIYILVLKGYRILNNVILCFYVTKKLSQKPTINSRKQQIFSGLLKVFQFYFTYINYQKKINNHKPVHTIRLLEIFTIALKFSTNFR